MTEEIRNRNFQLFKWLGWLLFFLVLWLKGCGTQQNKAIATTKEVNGVFKEEKPNHTNLGVIDTVYIKNKPIIKYKNNEINKELALENYNLQIAYTNATDSIEKLKMYLNAIQLKKFEKTFENDDLKANIKGIAQGEVKEVGFDYTIKPKPIPITKFRLLAGVSLNEKVANLNLGFQNKKGNIFEVGYDTEKRINIGYKQSIFKIVK